MDAFTTKLFYQHDKKQYYTNLFPWLSEKQIKRYFNLCEDTQNSVNGILFNGNGKYYLLTPILLETIGSYHCVINDQKISCKLVTMSYDYYLQLFELDNCKIEYSIPIDKIEKVIPDISEKLEINAKFYPFKKILKNIPNGLPLQNLVYAITIDVEKGLPVYWNNLFIGITINKHEIMNIYTIVNFISDSINNKYNGIKTIFYKTNKLDSEITDTYDIQSNLQIKDSLLEINKFPIKNNSIQHPELGTIPVLTFVMLTNLDSVKFKINRNENELEINVSTQPIHNYELISHNLNQPTQYKKVDTNIYYELNLAILRCYITLKGSTDRAIHDICTDCNLNPTKELNTRMIFKFNPKKFKNKILSLEDHIEIIGNKKIANLNDL